VLYPQGVNQQANNIEGIMDIKIIMKATINKVYISCSNKCFYSYKKKGTNAFSIARELGYYVLIRLLIIIFPPKKQENRRHSK